MCVDNALDCMNGRDTVKITGQRRLNEPMPVTRVAQSLLAELKNRNAVRLSEDDRGIHFFSATAIRPKSWPLTVGPAPVLLPSEGSVQHIPWEAEVSISTAIAFPAIVALPFFLIFAIAAHAVFLPLLGAMVVLLVSYHGAKFGVSLWFEEVFDTIQKDG